jgi:hypothetical protein
MCRLVSQTALASPSSSSSGSSSGVALEVGSEAHRMLNLTKPQLYMELADKLTNCVQQIIDFAKMVRVVFLIG